MKFRPINKIMYTKKNFYHSTIETDFGYDGEDLETKMERAMANKEPIEGNGDTIYTDRRDGVLPQYDIRTDRWDVALEAMDKVTASTRAKRENRMKLRTEAEQATMQAAQNKTE